MKSYFNTTLFTFLFSTLTFLGFSQSATFVTAVTNNKNFVSTNSAVYFIHSTSTADVIYKTDGTVNGTAQLPNTFSTSTRISDLIELNKEAYFVAQNNTTTFGEIWKLTLSGAVLVDQINRSITTISKYVVQDGQIYFVCPTLPTLNGSNQAVFRTTGIAGSTKLAAFLPTTNVSGGYVSLNNIGSSGFYLFFTNLPSGGYSTFADELGNQKIINNRVIGITGSKLCTISSDSLFSETLTTPPIFVKKGIDYPTSQSVQVNNKVYFTGRNLIGTSYTSFTVTDGTSQGTKRLAIDSLGFAFKAPGNISNPKVIGTTLYFQDLQDNNRIWKVSDTDTTIYKIVDYSNPNNVGFYTVALNDSIYVFARTFYGPQVDPFSIYKVEQTGLISKGAIDGITLGANGVNVGYCNGNIILDGYTPAGIWKLQISTPTIPLDTFLTVKNGVLDTFHNDVNTCFACTATGTSFGWEIYKHTSDKDSVLIKKGIPIYQGDYANAEIVTRIVNGNRWIIRTNNTFSPATSSSERNYCYFSTDLSGKGINFGLCQYFTPDASSTGQPKFGKSFTTLDSFYYEDPYNRNSLTNGSRFFRTNGLTWDEIPFIPASIDTTKSDLTIVGNTGLLNLISGQSFKNYGGPTISNIGINNTYKPFTVNLYLSKDNLLSPDDRLIGKKNILQDLGYGAINYINIALDSFQIPNDVTAGSYNLIFKVDGDDAIIESNENNNLLISPVTITNPNLTAKLSATPALPPDAVLTTGKLINLNYSRATWASGANRTDSFSLKFYFSKDTLFSADDYFIGTFKENFRTDTTLGNAYFNTNLVPASFASGTYYIVFDIDSEQKILESTKSDNKSFLRVVWSNGTTANPCDTDKVAPIFSTCPANITQIVTDSTKCATISWVEPTAADNCTTPTVVRTGLASGSCFKAGVNAISYAATDAKGNKSTCSFNIAVNVVTVVTGTYCTSKANLPWSEWIAGVQLSTLNNASSKEGYGDFTNLTATVQSGTTYTFTLTPGFSWAGDPNNATLQWRVWIDFNKNGVFDSTELVSSGNRNNFTGTIAIPSNATGSTRMRVSMKTLGAPTACEVFDRGEVEDYTVTFSGIAIDPCLSDTTKPVFANCPANIVQTVSDSSKLAVITWIAPSVTDNCTASPAITIVGAPSGASFSPKAVSNIVYTATDAKGNSSSCSFSITVKVSNVVATAYCASKGNLPWSEWISAVQFASISNSSIKEGYGDFTAQTATVKQGTTYPITVTPSFSWAGDPSNATLQWKVWIDYDNNKVFDASELVASGTRTSSTANILIPANAPLGTTRMRVSLKTIGAPTACEVFDRGEVEDYTVVITSAGANPCLNDSIAPVFTNCPANIVTTYSAPATCANVTWQEPTATDNCSTPTIIKTSTALNGGCYTGDYTHTYTATDAKGNKTICTFKISATQSVITASPITMTLTANPVSYKQYQTVTYRLTVVNTGAALTNVVIAFKRPTLSSSGSTKTASVGTFNDYCAGGIECSQWNIPTLATNSTATLDVPVFILGATSAITASAQFKSSTPALIVADATLSINPSLNFIGQKNILELSAQQNWDEVQLNWISNATNVDYFDIQRAEINSDFSSIGKIAQTANLKTYSFTDAHLNDGDYFYRIKSTQLDGSEKFSSIQKVNVILQNGLQVFPNPATDELTVALKNNFSELTRVSIFNSLGVSVKNISKDALNGTHLTTDVSDLPTGTYLVRLVSKNKRDIMQRFVIVR